MSDRTAPQATVRQTRGIRGERTPPLRIALCARARVRVTAALIMLPARVQTAGLQSRAAQGTRVRADRGDRWGNRFANRRKTGHRRAAFAVKNGFAVAGRAPMPPDRQGAFLRAGRFPSRRILCLFVVETIRSQENGGNAYCRRGPTRRLPRLRGGCRSSGDPRRTSAARTGVVAMSTPLRSHAVSAGQRIPEPLPMSATGRCFPLVAAFSVRGLGTVEKAVTRKYSKSVARAIGRASCSRTHAPRSTRLPNARKPNVPLPPAALGQSQKKSAANSRVVTRVYASSPHSFRESRFAFGRSNR